MLPACTSPTADHTGAVAEPRTERLYVCSGYGCHYRTRLDLGPADAKRFAEIMAAGRASPRAEREAISRAVQYYEKRAGAAIGVIDDAKSVFGASGELGQMDCIDESTNTRSLLLYLERRGLLKHHAVGSNVSRGFFIDGRYPHSTAVVRENSGQEWAVDSWFPPMGEAPEILPMEQWLKRGVLGSNDPV
ncbi:MAG TPA: hypothetical protein GX405_15270 [Rhizobiales bacterium]|nr:hypothetical protein [Hyphomicrobiales bacterium]